MMFLLAMVGMAGPGWPQSNPFAAAVRVNDRFITQYEIDQRKLFYKFLNGSGDLEGIATERLIDERLLLDAAAQFGVTVSDDQVVAGMREFASRMNLTTEQLLPEFGEAGIAPETFEDFVRVGVAWRSVVRGLFGPRTQVTDAEVDRALELSSNESGVQVLISEIFLPTGTPAQLETARQRAQEISEITTFPAFAAAARQYSAAASSQQGGLQDWIPISNLPPAIRSQILTLAPGEVTNPISVPDAIALFQMRDIQETGLLKQDAAAVDFARYFIPGGSNVDALAEVENIRHEVDTCDDLYGMAREQPNGQLIRNVLPVEELQGDIASKLEKLDEGEDSIMPAIDSGQGLVFLMLCGRVPSTTEDINRETVRRNLSSQRLASYADGYLAELRADAVIQKLQ